MGVKEKESVIDFSVNVSVDFSGICGVANKLGLLQLRMTSHCPTYHAEKGGSWTSREQENTAAESDWGWNNKRGGAFVGRAVCAWAPEMG